MGNNAIVGFAFQKAICDIYNIKLISEEAKKQFDVVSDLELLDNLKPIIIEIFNELGVKPVECTTYKKMIKSKGYHIILYYLTEKHYQSVPQIQVGKWHLELWGKLDMKRLTRILKKYTEKI